MNDYDMANIESDFENEIFGHGDGIDGLSEFSPITEILKRAPQHGHQIVKSIAKRHKQKKKFWLKDPYYDSFTKTQKAVYLEDLEVDFDNL